MPNLKILECENCGIVTFDSLDHISDTYYEDSGMHTDTLVSIDEWLRQLDRDDSRRVKYLGESITNKNILDFGCGPGSFILKARQKAKKVYGLELESRLQPFYAQKNIEVFQNIDDIQSDLKFDLITAFHVVEHLKDPIKTLQELSKFLAKDGRIIIEVPSSNDALLTLYKSKRFSEFTYWSCHLFLFNAANLKLLAKKAGLKVDFVDHVQRYPLSNHLHWLSNGKPGGHEKWNFLDSSTLNSEYEAQLASLGITDTLMASFSL